MSPLTELAVGRFVCVELTAPVVLLGLHRKALVAGGFCKKLPLCPLETMPAGFQVDPALSEAEPGSGSTSGITQLIRGRKNVVGNWSTREEWECVRETVLQSPRSMQKDGLDVLQVAEKSFLCSLVRQAVTPTAHGGPWCDWYPPTVRPAGEDACQRMLWPCGKLEQALDRACGHMERGPHAGTDLLAGFVTLRGTEVGAFPLLKDHPVEGTHTGSVCEELQPLGRICIGEICREQGQSFGWAKGLGFSLL